MATPVYFTCTLGQARSHGRNEAFTNINNFLQDIAKTNPDGPAVGFFQPPADGDEEWSTKLITFSELLHGSCATADLIATQTSISDRQPVALLCASTPEFLFTWLTLMRLGHPVLLIAPQCSPSAIARLCELSMVRHLFCDELYAELGRRAVDESVHTSTLLESHALPFTDDLGPFDLASKALENKREPSTSDAARDHVAYLHHTSGTSAGVPKPIPQTHFAGAGAYENFDGSQHPTFTTTPLYHGGIADAFRAWTSNALIWLFPGKGVPVTATNICKCLHLAAESATTPPVKYFSSVPYVLQMMASEDQGMQWLRRMDIVGVGGAALPSEAGRHLVDEGVNLISRFGSAECGFLASSHRDYNQDKAWDYLRFEGGLCFESRDGGLSELVVPPDWPHITKTDKIRDDGSFATCDLFRPHPSIANAWKYDSRADSQLTLITGKKFDPAPLEDALAARSALLQDVLIFGSGRPCPGALLFRSCLAKEFSDADLLAEVGPALEELNRESQSHARIQTTMLVPMPYTELPLEKSSKGTILRKVAEERYATEIESSYEREMADESDRPDEEIESFVLDAVRAVADPARSRIADLRPETDLFAFGTDSVACLQIRHAVSKLLPAGSARLPITIVQDTGSIKKLSERLIDLRHDRDTTVGSEGQAQLMRELVAEYSQLDTPHRAERPKPLPTPPRTPSLTEGKPGKTALLTGSTGALGSQLLHQLVSSTDIAHVHLLLRDTSLQAAERRVRAALTSRKLPMLADFDKKVTVHICTLSEPRLGLDEETYSTLVREVDIIFHLAWAVDFVLPLQAFKQHFAGLQGLLELSLARTKTTSQTANARAESQGAAQVIFCSSTASVASYKHGPIPEQILTEPHFSGDIGYSRSKWVAENICHEASKTHPALRGKISIVRVGQLSGDTVHGIWNKSEAYPLMLSSARATGCLPDLQHESVGWLPVDSAATAFLQLGLGHQEPRTETGDDGVQVVHLLSQDRTTTWSKLLAWLGKAGDFEVVEPREWLDRLERLSASEEPGAGTRIPCLKLLGFWKSAYGGLEDGKVDDVDGERAGSFSMQDSTRAMPVLKAARAVDEEYALKLWRWVQGNV